MEVSLRTKTQGSTQKKSATTTMIRRKDKPDGTISPTHEAIAIRAYELYKKSGCRSGCDAEFWLEAEHQLRQELISA
jgi:DUF2934 family protein